MNCIEKMYKEIEEIIRKEKLEYEKLAVPIREIKHGFSSDETFLTEPDHAEPINYLSEIALGNEWVIKPLTEDRAKVFIAYIFKKFVCFSSVSNVQEKFFDGLDDKINVGGDLIEILVKLENEFIDLLGGETEEIKAFFTNPYNALFKNENGYYAVIKNGKFTDVKRPTPFNPNQLKKIIKETFDEYVNHFSPKFSAEKEKVAFLNSLKADINKSQAEAICLEEECLEKLKALLEKKGVSEAQLLSYVSSAGLSLVKVNNCYYRKKAYTEFENYKKIEFRY